MSKGIHLPDDLLQYLILLKSKYSLSWLKLYGSRARGDHTDVSDVDLAYQEGEKKGIHNQLFSELDECPVSLLKIDLVNIDEVTDSIFKERILSEGIDIEHS